MLTQESQVELLLESPGFGSSITRSLSLIALSLTEERVGRVLDGMMGHRQLELSEIENDDCLDVAVLFHPAVSGASSAVSVSEEAEVLADHLIPKLDVLTLKISDTDIDNIEWLNQPAFSSPPSFKMALKTLVLSTYGSISSSLYTIFSPCNNLTHLQIANASEEHLPYPAHIQDLFESVAPNLTKLTITLLVPGQLAALFICRKLSSLVLYCTSEAEFLLTFQQLPATAQLSTLIIHPPPGKRRRDHRGLIKLLESNVLFEGCLISLSLFGFGDGFCDDILAEEDGCKLIAALKKRGMMIEYDVSHSRYLRT